MQSEPFGFEIVPNGVSLLSGRVLGLSCLRESSWRGWRWCIFAGLRLLDGLLDRGREWRDGG